MGKNRHLRGRVHPWLKWFMLVKPDSATEQVWDRWERRARAIRPVRYFLQETLPLRVKFVMHRINNAVWWVRYRTTEKYHVIKTELRPGYADADDQLLYACFSILVDHVEQGLAGRNYDYWTEQLPEWLRPPEDYQEHKTLKDHGKEFIRRHFYPMRMGSEAGLDYLRRSTTDPEILKHSPEQAVRDLKIMRLYNWWTVERDQRVEAFGDPRLWEGVERPKSMNQIIMSFNNKASAYTQACEVARRIDEFYKRQDQAMLEELIKIRAEGLWA